MVHERFERLNISLFLHVFPVLVLISPIVTVDYSETFNSEYFLSSDVVRAFRAESLRCLAYCALTKNFSLNI